jgi:hypothetical protein
VDRLVEYAGSLEERKTPAATSATVISTLTMMIQAVRLSGQSCPTRLVVIKAREHFVHYHEYALISPLHPCQGFSLGLFTSSSE